MNQKRESLKASRVYYLRESQVYHANALKSIPELQAILKSDPDARKIPLTNTTAFMVVHKDDYELLSTFKWRLHWKGYAQSYFTKSVHGVRDRKTLKAHRLVMNPEPREHVDHINFCKLDNRRSNLRIATTKQSQRSKKLNIKNTTGYLGVYARKDKWEAYIKGSVAGSRSGAYLGTYDDIEDAITAADLGRLMVYGKEWAVLNRPLEEYLDFLEDIQGVDFSDFIPADYRVIIISYLENHDAARWAINYLSYKKAASTGKPLK